MDHQHITYCLQHYHAPQTFRHCYQPLPRNPLTVIIFSTVISTLTDNLRASQHCRYTLLGSRICTNVLLYADDTCLVADASTFSLKWRDGYNGLDGYLRASLSASKPQQPSVLTLTCTCMTRPSLLLETDPPNSWVAPSVSPPTSNSIGSS